MHKLLHRWNDLPVDSPIPKLKRRRVIGEQAMISHIHLQTGCQVPLHQHENEQFAVVISGLIEFELGDPKAGSTTTVSVHGGDILHLPSNLPHSARAIQDTVILDVFSPPSETTGIDDN
jgi:quercetin dioxygenase-like cupin family protein